MTAEEDGRMTTTFLTLPAPPSTNMLFRNVRGKGRVRTEKYDAWLAEAGWKLRMQRPESVKGPVVLVIGVERMSKTADIDNRIKAVADLLVKHRVIDDDKNVMAVAAAWASETMVAIMAANTNPILKFLDGSGWFITQLEQAA